MIVYILNKIFETKRSWEVVWNELQVEITNSKDRITKLFRLWFSKTLVLVKCNV